MKGLAAQRVRERLEALGLSPAKASALAGLGRDTVRSILRRPNDSPRAATLAALAPVLGRSVDWLSGASDDEANPFSVEIEAAPNTFGRRPPGTADHGHFRFDDAGRAAPAAPTPRPPRRPLPPGPEPLPYRGRAAAGLWVEDEAELTDEGHAPFAADPRFPPAAQYSLAQEGDSLNEIYPPGVLVHVVARDAYSAWIRPGDLVVLARRRGGLLERSVKELRADVTGRLQAWPRSTNPRWSEALDLAADLDDGDVVTIEGVVIGAYVPRR